MNQNLKHEFEFYKNFFLKLLNYLITVNSNSNLSKDSFQDIIFTGVGFINICSIFIITRCIISRV